MTVRVLLSAADLRGLIEKHPEIEADLIRSAVPQVAEMIRKKAVEKEPVIKKTIEETFRRLMLEQGRNYGISDAMRGVVRVYLAEVWEAEAKRVANDAARTVASDTVAATVKDEFAKARKQIAAEEAEARARIDTYAREAAEREVLALLRAGKLATVA